MEGGTFPANLVQQRAAAGKPQQRSLVKKKKKKKSLSSESLLMAGSLELPSEERWQRATGDVQHNGGTDALLAALTCTLSTSYLHTRIYT